MGKPGTLDMSKMLPQNVIMKQEDSLISGIEFELGRKNKKGKGYIDVKSKEDFPDLLGGGGPVRAKPTAPAPEAADWGNIFTAPAVVKQKQKSTQPKKKKGMETENFPSLAMDKAVSHPPIVEEKKQPDILNSEEMPSLGEEKTESTAGKQGSKKSGSRKNKKGGGGALELKGGFF